MRLGYDAKYERLNDLVWQWFCVVRTSEFRKLPKSELFGRSHECSDFRSFTVIDNRHMISENTCYTVKFLNYDHFWDCPKVVETSYV